MTAPDRAALVEEIEAFFRKWPSLASSTGDWSMLQRARDMIVADAATYLTQIKAYADAVETIANQNKRLIELESAATKAPLPETIKQTVAELREWSKDQRYGYFPGTLKDAANWLESLSRALAAKDEECIALVAGITDQQQRREKCEAKCSALEAALRELVECKDLKDALEVEWGRGFRNIEQKQWTDEEWSAKQSDYDRRKPLAWKSARAALASQPPG